MKHVVICKLCSKVQDVARALPTGWCCPSCTAKQYLGAMRQAGSNAGPSFRARGAYLVPYATPSGWEIGSAGFIKNALCFPVVSINTFDASVFICVGIDAYLWGGQLQPSRRSYWQLPEEERGKEYVTPPHIRLTRLSYRVDQLRKQN